MKWFLLAGLVLACTLAAQSNPGTGSIEGHVLNSLTSAPVRKATVTLTAAQARLVAEADAAGRFQFTALPPGSYKLSATHSGFLDHAARRPITVGQDDHVTDAEIRLPPQGVITGHVLDEDDDPMGGAVLTIFKQTYRDGRKRWGRLNIPYSSPTIYITNETGEYRFPNLSPGRYLVQARSQHPFIDSQYGDYDQPDKHMLAYVPAYYPNAPSEDSALPVDVGIGAELRGIDIHLFKRVIPPVFHVSGKVTGAPPDPQIEISVVLYSTDDAGHGGSTSAMPPDYAFVATAQPGQYAILASAHSGGWDAYATGSVTVAGNVTGVVLAMSPTPDITGRISLAEIGSQVKLQGVRATLHILGSMPGTPPVRADATGKLAFGKPGPPDHYRLELDMSSLPDGCYLRTVRLGGQEVSAADFEIQTSAQLDIVLSHTAGTITGSVSDEDGKPFPNSSVTLIPTDGMSPPVRQSVDDDGNFKFTGVRPGKYKLFAWEEVDDGLWPDPEFRQKYENRATEINVGPNETQTAHLRVIAAEEMK
ncbi:MAG: carboxypeptidase-like regulatory domain-containing protein [Bryobacteraceae bacterium]|jgi:protocatechuate 3,4-dioxygenase beta subunit